MQHGKSSFAEGENESMILVCIDQQCISADCNPLYTQSENDVSRQKKRNRTMSLVYSEPAVADLGIQAECSSKKKVPCSSSCLKFPYCNDSEISWLLDNTNPPAINLGSKNSCIEVSSCFFEGNKQCFSSATVITIDEVPRKSHSTREIREQHAEVQKKYRCDRQRRYTDPVDFEGILKILGDCTWWHIWVYILISVQQIPHAMFSSSVVFLMYQPDYWCKVPEINDSNMAKSAYKWSLKDVLETSVVFPLIKINHKNESLLHDQCRYYNRTFEKYEELHQMDLSQAIIAVRNESTDIAYCQRWEYDKSIMRSTIVTDWNLVCSDHFKEAYVHLLCSLGFFSGCLLGGYVSDRFGRRITIVGFGILSAIFGFFLPYSTRFSLFLLFRFLNAACNEAAQLAAYVLCIEVTGIRYRAAFGSMLQAPWVLGCLFVTLTAYISRSWRKVQLVTALLHVIAVLLLCALPESPRWLVISNRVEEAEHYIRQACRDPPLFFSMFNCSRPSLPCDLELVKHTEQQRWVKKNRQANVFSILKSRVLCFRAAVLSTIWISTALIYFVLFDQAGLGKFSISSNFFINNAIVAASEISAMFGCMYLFRFGHKNSQIIALIGAVTFMYATIGATHHNLRMVGIICLFFAKVFIRGSFNVLYIFSLELYPTVIRSSAIGINLMIAHLCSGVSSYLSFSANISVSVIPLTALFVFSVFATVLGIFLPESLDRPLPDTLQDAVTFLEVDRKRKFYSFVFRKF